MSAGRGSRLSQILQYTSEVIEAGTHYDPAAPSFNPADLSVVGIGDFANALLGDHVGVQRARQRLNSEYLEQLCFSGKGLEGHISVSGAKGETVLKILRTAASCQAGSRSRRIEHPQWRFGSSSPITWLTSGSLTPSVSLHLQGAPAPQMHPSSESQGFSG
jgi:hypothetical protein